MRKIELLSPAKNVEIGIEAVNHGADAVYIGAPLFGARAAAGNSVADIERLAGYAHRFGAKTFVALNTILNDDELREAERMAHELYGAGVDALIVQDMGLLGANLPPIDLHASTQTNNQTPERVRFLQEVGFKRVVLARELDLAEISTIYATTNVELETFVHGALCVSYSGQCYASQALCGRSANRGTCAQICRLPFDLVDASGATIVRDKHLLSLKDLERSQSLSEMVEAGVTSFKIEGRLKDMAYVKNIVTYYRQKLDALIESNVDEYERTSFGKSYYTFTSNPHKTFRRGAIDYFLYGRKSGMIQQETPKSLGEYIGRVDRVEKNSVLINTQKELNNGDGLCYIDAQHNFGGFKVNRYEDGGRVFPAQQVLDVESGARVYRNYDHAFDKLMHQKTAERLLPIDMVFAETQDGFALEVVQTDLGKRVSVECVLEKQLAQKQEQAMQNARTQLSKIGGTPYEMRSLQLELTQPWFLPASVLNDLRRRVIEALDAEKVEPIQVGDMRTMNDAKVSGVMDYTANVLNEKAREFYLEHGAEQVEWAYEREPKSEVPLMTTKYCLKYELGYCSKQGGKGKKLKSPLYLRNVHYDLRLHFDCKNCRMEVYAK